jgi:7-hydroxymethyl chlorophyll a reductase
VCTAPKQVQALRAVEPYLNLDALYVLGTNCVDNGPRQGLDKFLRAASAQPDTVLHYEFMQARAAPCCFCREKPPP